MKTSKLTARIVAISLAAGSCACRQSGALAEDSAEIAPAQLTRTALAPSEAESAAAAEPIKPKATATRPAPGQAIEHSRPAKTLKAASRDASSPFAIVPGAAGGGSGQNKPRFLRGLGYFDLARDTSDRPTLLTTEAIDEKVEAEWTEDLAIMDNLLRDAMSENGGGASTAMGIQIKVLGRMPASVSYVEDAGVILSSSVGWPLAASRDEAREAVDPNRPRDPDSPWDRKKRQLKGGPRDEFGVEHEVDGPPPAFDQKKLDDLIDDILYVLPQASNFRHLKPSESVFVTVGGVDDAGKPVRLTIKAKKSDIDEAAAKTIDAATFKQRVVRRVG